MQSTVPRTYHVRSTGRAVKWILTFAFKGDDCDHFEWRLQAQGQKEKVD
ncbi:hypothetical protein PDIP_52330 [Penicillium digitatum Pd1]|uniref:Uncharacterized protein n=1 Tax=Penicillium digitatum (strain Pd1 / CECT 20795) TaxID=1170230 RepID=K9FS76_PEND1|nr:hypothetical protein PDIP_52330 [Penicillium digitatum Pd1]EKV12530.1 hypothetical protein PDIP_52330 [Penicillium digitatum Pd1]